MRFLSPFAVHCIPVFVLRKCFLNITSPTYIYETYTWEISLALKTYATHAVGKLNVFEEGRSNWIKDLRSFYLINGKSCGKLLKNLWFTFLRAESFLHISRFPLNLIVLQSMFREIFRYFPSIFPFAREFSVFLRTDAVITEIKDQKRKLKSILRGFSIQSFSNRQRDRSVFKTNIHLKWFLKASAFYLLNRVEK